MATRNSKVCPTEMTSILTFTVGVLLCASGFHPVGATKTCTNKFQEKAYTGAYEIDFPRDCKSGAPSQSCWLIKAFRRGHRVQLTFSNVNITQDQRTNSCMEHVDVYDGKDVSARVLASFCGQKNPEITTTQRHAFIVFSSNSSYVRGGRFKVRYRAVKKRPGETDPFAISIAFGGSIGAIALLVICGGVAHGYKQAQRQQTGFFLFRRPRVTNGTLSGNGRGGNRGGTQNGGQHSTTRAVQRDSQTTSEQEQPQPKSIRGRILGFIQGVFKIKPSSNTETASSSPTRNSSSTITQQRRRSRERTTTNHRSSCPHRQQSSMTSNNRYPDFSSDGIDSDAFYNGHEAFGYQDIPVSSFSSDPDSVRPPTYEDSVNHVNPLYLCNYGTGVHFNQAFDMKEENTYIFSPPPPYSERHQVPGEDVVSSQPTLPTALALEVMVEPAQTVQPESINLERSPNSTDGMTVVRPSEMQKIAEQEINVNAKEPADNDKSSPEANEYVTKDDTNVGEQREESSSYLELSNMSNSKPGGNTDRIPDGQTEAESGAIDAVPGQSGAHGPPSGLDRNRQTVTIPLDMMRRSGLKTSQAGSPKHTEVTPVEECGDLAQICFVQGNSLSDGTDLPVTCASGDSLLQSSLCQGSAEDDEEKRDVAQNETYDSASNNNPTTS